MFAPGIVDCPNLALPYATWILDTAMITIVAYANDLEQKIQLLRIRLLIGP